MPVALDAVRYLGEHLSENIARTPEGYLICKNAIIGRTGFQGYTVGEIEPKKSTDSGEISENWKLWDSYFQGRSRDERIDLWRDPQEVFSPATLASFEGKTFTLTHPDTNLDPENEQEHHVGHVQNVRKGEEPLDSGDWPMLADIIVTDAGAIRAIEGGDRELSCGYTYRLAKNGERLEQHKIIGNHVALVPKGRAGDEARINDAAPTKETPVKTDFLKRIFALGFQAFAKDAKPEELATAIEEVGKAEPVLKEPRFVKIGTTSDGVDIFKSVAFDDDDKGKDDDKKNAKDAAEGGVQEEAERRAMDDRGKRLHGALDLLLQKEGEKKAAGDADLAELGKLFSQFMAEEGAEQEHAGDDDKGKAKDDKSEEELKPIGDDDKGKDDDEGKGKDDDKGKGKDDAEIVSPEPDLEKKQVPESQFDTAAVLLKGLRPFIAKCGDKKTIAAFNTALDSLNAARKKAGDGTGSYASFESAAQSLGKDTAMQGESPVQKEAKRIDAIYRAEMEKRSRRGKK
jgi:hypothetical protein